MVRTALWRPNSQRQGKYFSHLSLNPAQAAGEPMLERSALLFTSSGDIMRTGKPAKALLPRWSSQTRAVMSEEQHDQWHLLIHYGVQELLYFLYKCLVDLIHQGHREKAAEVLVRGCFYFISQTTMADCPHCL
jgi:hypothetical protein